MHADAEPQTPTLLQALILRACLSVRFQGFTPSPQYRPSASSRLWPARPVALCLPDPCGLGSDSHGGEVFSGKLLEFLTQTGFQRRSAPPQWLARRHPRVLLHLRVLLVSAGLLRLVFWCRPCRPPLKDRSCPR